MNYINFNVKNLRWLMFLGVLSLFFIGADQVQHPAAATGLNEVFTKQANSWSSGGPWGGYINSLSMFQTNPDIIYAGTLWGIYKTNDGAANWTKTGFSDSEVNVVEVDPYNSNIAYAGKDDGIYKSADGGNTWTQKGISGQNINRIAIDPNNTNILYAVTGSFWSYDGEIDGVFKSTDGGETWALKYSSDSGHVDALLIDTDNSSYVYAGVDAGYVSDYEGFLKSTDGGENWVAKNISGTSWGHISALAMTPAGSSPPALYAVCDGEDVFKSTDRGENWTPTNTPWISFSGPWAIAVDPINPSIIYVGTLYYGGCLYRSTDGGGTWSAKTSGPTDNCPSSIVINPNNSAVYLGLSEGGVYNSTDTAESWIYSSQGINNAYIIDLDVHPNSSDTVFGAIEGGGFPLFKTTDSGASWTHLGDSLSGIESVAFDPNNPSTMFLGNKIRNYGSLYKSTDEGNSWAEITDFDGRRIYDIWINPLDSNIILVAAGWYQYGNWIYFGGVFRNTDGGTVSDLQNWHYALNNYRPTCFASDPTNHQVVYLGAVDSYYTSRGAVYKSTDGGAGWADISPSSTAWVDNVTVVNDIVVDSNSKAYTATDYGLWIWDGAIWEHMSNLTSDDNITALAIDPSTNPNTIYMGSGADGVFYSDDGGTSWNALNAGLANLNTLNDGLGNLNITELTLSKTQPKILYAGTAYGGAWRISFVPTYTVSGTVSTVEASRKMNFQGGLSGVVMNGLPGNPTTDASGNYSATVEEGWSGTVTPTKAGYTFSPPSKAYTNVTSNQTSEDYTATAITPMISGAVKKSAGTGIAGVTITFPNGGGTATTDSDGNYSHEVSYGWSGTATPTKAGCTFTPPSRTYSNVTSDQTGEDYTGTVFTYTISGNVSTADASVKIQAAAALSGVVMDGLPGDPTTDASGNYNATVDYGFSETVTPTLAGYSFSPPSRDYSNVTSNQQDHNYTASIIQCTLTIVAGTGGTTTPTAGSSTHNYGTQVQVTAVPDTGYQFSGWTGAATGTTNPITITMDADKTITANFTTPPPAETGDGDGGGGGGCFIATAAYGSSLHPHLDILRDFRDTYLISSKLGRILVDLYYKYSPYAAELIAKHKVLRIAVRINLLPFVGFSNSMVHFGPIITAILLMFVSVLPTFFIWFYRRK